MFRAARFPIFHTREGHRPDLSTLSKRELFRSRNNPSQLGIGDPGPMGRALVRGEPGHDIIPELYPLPTENIVDKPGRSAFQHTDFKLMLDVAGIQNLILCGATTDVCVTSTMRDANDLGLDCLLVHDATAAGQAHLHEAAVGMIVEEGGIFGAVASTRSILNAFGREFSAHIVGSPQNGVAIAPKGDLTAEEKQQGIISFMVTDNGTAAESSPMLETEKSTAPSLGNR